MVGRELVNKSKFYIWDGYVIPKTVTRYGKEWDLFHDPGIHPNFGRVVQSRENAEKYIEKAYWESVIDVGGRTRLKSGYVKTKDIIVPITKRQGGKEYKIYVVYYRYLDL